MTPEVTWSKAEAVVAPGSTAPAPDGTARAAAAGRSSTTRHASRRQAWRWVLLAAAGWLIQLGPRVRLSRA